MHYCYDDAELRKLQRSFPSNASYNIQRFKGKINTILSMVMNALGGHICANQ